jgi:hypothetical protein
VLYSDIEFSRSAFSHRISEEDIRRALTDWIFEDQIDLTEHGDKHLLLGFDTKGRVLEILYNIIDEHTINVFHAMRCRKVWLSLAGLAD